MTDLTKASEALSRRKLVHTTYCYVASQGKPHESCTCGFNDALLAIEAAVRSDTLADVAARLPELIATTDCPDDAEHHDGRFAAAIIARLTGGTDR